jgi:hypothetical protein
MGILDTAKEAVQLVQKIDNIELYKEVLNLQSEAIKLVNENTALRNQISALEDRLKVKEALRFEKNSYWVEQKNSKEGPFCTLCWDKDQKLVRKHLDDTDRWYCPTHEKPNYQIHIA